MVCLGELNLFGVLCGEFILLSFVSVVGEGLVVSVIIVVGCSN